MSNLTIAKFGGSAIGIDGKGIPEIVKRIKEIQEKQQTSRGLFCTTDYG